MRVSTRPFDMKILDSYARKLQKKPLKRILEKPVLFSRICLQYFDHDCLKKRFFSSTLT